jgi:hypothetical protein
MVAQEKLIKKSSIPYSIVRATQFFEFVNRIADSATNGNTVRLPPVRFQPMAADLSLLSALCFVARYHFIPHARLKIKVALDR